MITRAPAAITPVLPSPAADGAVTRRSVLTRGVQLGCFAALAGVTTGSYAAAEAAFGLVTTNYRLTPPGWPAGHPLTISVIADLHAGGPNVGLERVRQVVDACNALRSDLVVLLGDYFATHRFVTEVVPHAAWTAELARLKARLGTWAIFGNHDWWYDIIGVRRALANVRIPVLENDAVLLGDSSRKFWLAGLGDQLAYVLGHGRFRGADDLSATLGRVNTDDPVLLLAHEPDIFPKVPSRVALTLAGHTHGGQIRMPFVPPLWTPSAYGARFAYGHIVEGGRHMIVSGGIGTSKVPLRLGVPPEIVRIELGA